MEEIGNKYFQLMEAAKNFKSFINEDKVGLGGILNNLKKFYQECEMEGIEEFGTFNTCLAELHLNLRRSIKLMQNAEYLEKYNVSEKDWNFFDSSVIELMRKKNKNPLKYLDDIKGGLSYTDLKEIICEKIQN